MEHIIQFGVNIDEERIVDTVIEKSSSEIKKSVQKKLDDYTFRTYGDTRLDVMCREEIKKILDEHKEEIVERAIERLTSNITKTKIFKDKMSNIK